MNLKDFVKIRKLNAFLITLFTVTGAGLVTLGNYTLGLIVNALKENKLSEFLFICICSCLILLTGYFLNPLSEYLFNCQIQIYLHQIRMQLVKSICKKRNELIVSKVQNKLTNDLNILSTDYLTKIQVIIRQIFNLFFSGLALFLIHWSLLLVTIILSCIMLILPQLFSKALQRATVNVSKENHLFLGTIAQWFSGFAELIRYHAQKKLETVMSQSASNLEKQTISRIKIQTKLSFVNLIFNLVAQSIILILAGALIYFKLVPFSVILTATQFGSTIFNGLQIITDARGTIISTKSLNQKLKKIINQKSKTSIDESTSNIAKIEVKNLSINYKNGESLSFPDLLIKFGEKILITGDSGSGKSTLLKLISGYLTPSKGEIIYRDENGKVIKPETNEFSYIPQDSILFPDKIIENITMFNEKFIKKAQSIIVKMNLQKDLKQFPQGENTIINLEKPNFSGGQRQKIVLTRALTYQQRFLLIDEGTSAIDQTSTRKIIKNILKTPATVIFIAHNFDDELKKLFQREIIIKK